MSYHYLENMTRYYIHNIPLRDNHSQEFVNCYCRCQQNLEIQFMLPVQLHVIYLQTIITKSLVNK